jgi:hypothetical protein
LIQLIDLEDLPGHHLRRGALVHIALDALAQGRHLLARHAQFARQPRRGFAFGDATQQEYERGWPLAAAFKDRAGQQGVVAVTGAAAVGRAGLLYPEKAAIGAATVGTDEALRMQMALQPQQAEAIINQIGDRKVNHAPSVPSPALPLDMSHSTLLLQMSSRTLFLKLGYYQIGVFKQRFDGV